VLNVFVEGDVDTYFYGQICQQVLPGPFMYQIRRSDQLGGQGRGKSHMLRVFASMRRSGILVLDFKGRKSAAMFFLDKDLDDLRRIKKRSPHLVYTEYYEVENYLFKHGDLVMAVGAACLKDTTYVRSTMASPDTWASRAAALWSDWLKLCMAGMLLDARGVCNYSALSSVNSPFDKPADDSRYRAEFSQLESASNYTPNVFQQKFARLSLKVDALYATGRQDVVFKGKWYAAILAEELKTSGVASGAALTALPVRLVGHLLQSLDFGDEWASYHREAVKRVVALTR
jgi:hypothetical protein